jgi:hypothetical protein
MGRYPPTGGQGFTAAVVGCVGLVIAGLALVGLTGGDVRALGTSFLTLGLLGLFTAAGGLLAERMAEQRTTTRWPEGQGGNGSGPDRDYAAGP